MLLLKKLSRILWILFFAILLSVCIFLGVVPVLPKRKEQVAIEIKMEPEKEKAGSSEKLAQYRSDIE
jgi:hypothetical protein